MRLGIHLRLGIACAAVLSLSAASLHVTPASAQETSDDIATAVSPPHLPTEVAVGAYLLGLSQVSEPSDPFPTIDVEMFLNLCLAN